jgi:hypothetical protein
MTTLGKVKLMWDRFNENTMNVLSINLYCGNSTIPTTDISFDTKIKQKH